MFCCEAEVGSGFRFDNLAALSSSLQFRTISLPFLKPGPLRPIPWGDSPGIIRKGNGDHPRVRRTRGAGDCRGPKMKEQKAATASSLGKHMSAREPRDKRSVDHHRVN